MGEEIKMSEAKSWQLRFAKSLRAEPEVLEVLNQTQDDLTRMWLVICMVDGIDKEQISLLAGANISKIQLQRNEYLKEKYESSEELHQTVRLLKQQVAKDLQESREVRFSIEQGLDVALKEQARAQKELVESKDEVIAILRKQLVEMERKTKQLESSMKESREEYSERPAAYPDKPQERFPEQRKNDIPESSRKIRELQEAMLGRQRTETVSEPERKENAVKRLWAYCRKTMGAKRFIDTYLKDENMNPEQKEFLLQCLEQGKSVKEIEVFASPNLPVDIMKRLQKYYEGHPQT